MITRRQYRTLVTTQRGESNVHHEQQATPVYDAIAQALRDWDVLRIAHHDLAYETDVLWLLRHLPATANHHDVEALLQERFGQQQGSNQFDPEDVLRMKVLAEDIFACWNQYLQRHEPSALTQQTHTRSRMRRFVLP